MNLFILISVAIKNSLSSVYLINIIGCVYSFITQINQNQIDLTAQPTGIYLLKLYNDGGVKVEKIVLQ